MTFPRQIAILGSTGSIGCNAVAVAQAMEERIAVVALAAGNNWRLAAEQARALHPRLLAVREAGVLDALRARLRELGVDPPPVLMSGPEGLLAAATTAGADCVLAATVGVAALPALHAAVSRGVNLALANKEALVAGGALLTAAAASGGAAILPVDSEHCAIHQCLRAGSRGEVQRFLLTASGGPFLRHTREQMDHVTAAAALRHPTWAMGDRVTLDSATLMNKGFEVIEACWLFAADEKEIEVLVHPQSIVHSMVEFRDGSVIAQMSPPDMRAAIQYALTWPARVASPRKQLKLEQVGRLDFEAPDAERFPCLELARQAFRAGGAAAAVLNAADEVAVEAFARGRLAFPGIAAVVAATLDRLGAPAAESLEQVMAADATARQYAEDWVYESHSH